MSPRQGWAGVIDNFSRSLSGVAVGFVNLCGNLGLAVGPILISAGVPLSAFYKSVRTWRLCPDIGHRDHRVADQTQHQTDSDRAGAEHGSQILRMPTRSR